MQFLLWITCTCNFAETSKTRIKEIEYRLFTGYITSSDPSNKDGDPGTCKLIRAASKAFGEGSGGDEKSGSFKTYVNTFLRQYKFKSLPLRSYRGARFNILFQNAAAVFFLHSQMTEFLESYGTENRLLKSILSDLKTIEFIAGVKALGLIYLLITCPLWTVLEDPNITITDMNDKYLQLVTFLDDS